MLTKEQALKNHRKLWKHIAEKTRAEKRQVGKLEAYKDIWGDVMIASDCWCCEYDNQFKGGCEHCPVVWSNEKDKCFCGGNSEYGKWYDACTNEDWEKAAEMAERIANLPEREGV